MEEKKPIKSIHSHDYDRNLNLLTKVRSHPSKQ